MPPSIRYEIIDGVRRAKVFHQAGIQTIQAIIRGQNGVVQIPIDQLGSPHKHVIDTTISGGSIRFNRIVNVVAAGNAASLPPIEVRRGNRPPHISQVQVN
jgi:hypothetical protein